MLRGALDCGHAFTGWTILNANMQALQYQEAAASGRTGHGAASLNTESFSKQVRVQSAQNKPANNKMSAELVQLLRLFCCSFRRTLRHVTKGLQLDLSSHVLSKGSINEQAADHMKTILTAIIDLVKSTVGAIDAMERVSFSQILKERPSAVV